MIGTRANTKLAHLIMHLRQRILVLLLLTMRVLLESLRLYAIILSVLNQPASLIQDRFELCNVIIFNIQLFSVELHHSTELLDRLSDKRFIKFSSTKDVLRPLILRDTLFLLCTKPLQFSCGPFNVVN